MRTLVILGVLAVATALLGRMLGVHNKLFLAAEVALLASMFVISRYVLPLVDRRDRGARAEEQVGGMLEGMRGQGWRVIHDASLGSGNVDHILIGRAGIFTIETKSHPGPVRVRRVHPSTLRQAQAQQRAIEQVSGMRVEPLIVYSRAWVDRPGRRNGVLLIPARMLAGHLARLRPMLTDEQVETAYALIASALADHYAHMAAMRAQRIGPRAERVVAGVERLSSLREETAARAHDER